MFFLFFFVRYGPCQTPTLGFCVQRYLQISTFKPEKFWVVHPYIIKNGYELKLDWDRNRLFDHDVRFSLLWSSLIYAMCIYFVADVYNHQQVAEMFQKIVVDEAVLKVTNISEKQDSKGRPSGLNTVNLLKVRKCWESPFYFYYHFVVKIYKPLHSAF